MRKQLFFLSILILFLLAAPPRGVELVSDNYLFGFDQGLFFEAVKRIVVDHKLTLIGAETGGQGGIFQGPGWYYLLSIPFIVTGGDPYGAMVLLFVLGICTVIFAFILAEKMFDMKTAFFISLLIAISPAIIAQSRFIWPPFVISLLSVFYLYFLFKVLQKEEKSLPLLTFTVGLMFHFEIATGASLLAQLLLFSPILFIKRLVSRRFFLFSLGSLFLPLTPLFLFDIRHQFIISKGLLKLLSNPNPSHTVTFRYIEAMFTNHFDVFKANFLSVFHNSNILGVILLLILFIGSIVFIKDKKNSFAKRAFVFYLATSPLALFLILMLYLWPIWEWWLLELMIFYCFLLGILVSYLWKATVLRLFIAIIFGLFLVGYAKQVIQFYRADVYDFGGTHKIKGKLEVIDAIYQDAKGEKFGLLIFTPPIYTYAYDYLLWWHGEKKYLYLPHRGEKGLFYLLIEPDPHKPWSYKGWLETVIKEGEILETKELPSGFIIQKRFMKDQT